MNVRVVNKSNHPLPEYKTEGSAGVDLRANISAPILLQPMERKLIPTGIFMELPHGYEAQVRPRSGLAYKHGITVANAPGTIDSDYRGELKVILVNISNENYTIHDGDRVAQLILAKHDLLEWQEVESLIETERGSGGFGHTGTK